jgi:DNA repair exonuclease SbcCD nuclease subunit
MTKNKKLTKTACLTDIHWGARTNDELHNQDCDRYIDWFCAQVKADPTIDNIMFLGDWFENRSALNIMTMNYSYRGAKKLNDLGLPVYFIIGNHDLYHRHTRELYSSINFHEFSNFRVINEPTVIPEVGDGVLLCPYLFHHEYADLAQYLKLKTWFGHFEFKGFQVTGSGMLMPTGPEADDFKGPLHIFSGHFHKRQLSKNIVYTGNTFPTNYSDEGDNERGMMVYDHTKDVIKFIDWIECPKFTKITLTNLLDNTVKIHKGSRVKCIVDCPITFEESTLLRQQFLVDYDLREFVMEESGEVDEVLANTETDADTEDLNDDGTITSIDDLVVKMLSGINSELIDNNILIAQYQRLKL